MQIESIKIKNYRVFQDVEINDIPPFVVLVGANGTGKSTLFDVFAFLKDALKNNVTAAIERRGGFQEVVTRQHQADTISFTLKFRTELNGKARLVTYFLELAEKNSRVIIQREYIQYKRGAYGSPYQYFNFSMGEGYAVTNEEDFDKETETLERENQVLDAPDILALKGLGQFKRFKAANAFRSLIENWHVSDFHITEAQKLQDAGHAEHLSASGDNLSLVANYLQKECPDRFQKILTTMAKRVPGVEKVEPIRTEDGRLVLKFQDGSFKDPFIARWVSDGTIKMFAYLVLLHDPKPHPLLCVEEPENQLYPSLLPELVEEFQQYCYPSDKHHEGGQVFVTTHSPDLLNAVPFESIFWLEKNEGVTHIYRARDNNLLNNLIVEGDLPGYLWKQGLFGRVNP